MNVSLDRPILTDMVGPVQPRVGGGDPSQLVGLALGEVPRVLPQRTAGTLGPLGPLAELIHTNLSDEQEKALREAFA